LLNSRGHSHARLRFLTAPIAAVAGVALLAYLAACGGSSNPAKPKPEPPDCSSVADTTQPATVSYENDIVPMFAELSNGGYGCADAGCHGGAFLSSNYSVESRDDILAPGNEATARGFCVVKPGAPEDSYLVMKLEGRAGIEGVQMPNGRTSLTAADLQKVKTWILEGARDN
jgi:hypothetical protein